MVIDLRSILSDPLIVPRLIIWSVVVGILSITVADPDLWGHVAFGRDIINTFELPVNDPYSFTADRPWVNHEWLSEVLMALAHQVAGPTGLSILKLMLLLTTFVLVMKELKARGVPPINRDVIAIVCLVGSLTLTRTVRPQTFSLLCAALLVMAIRRADERPRALWTIPVLMAVWANLHGGWLVGMGILSIAALDRVVTLRGAARLHWAVAMTASLVATLVTPYGVGLWLFLWRTVGLTRADISEWQSLANLSAAHWVPWMIVTIFAVIAFVRDRSRRASEVVLVLALMALSFKVWRVVPFYAVSAAMLLGPGPRAATRQSPRRLLPQPRDVELIAVGMAAILFATGSAVVTVKNAGCIQMAGAWTPDQQAAKFIRDAGLNGRMLTWFDWGEYAIWSLSPKIRVSMDGRRETIYSDNVIAQHLAIYSGEGEWKMELGKLDPDYVWLPIKVPTLDIMEASGWTTIFRSQHSAVLSRRPVTSSPGLEIGSASCFPGVLS